ncbi:hypothetical protein SRABI70_00395 [Pseudomonas sp. Bi70]|uniref:hypothetical protein n=1 Tax=Pseudomonas sp. Bi70 TaxID=2821127 RepID=UPI001E188010|nr:hypothetical protein [Pseudomonas sp. Bi70]CAH0145582.1 hypothetical protein SRABI70_00395 [Pseudomonas sp. Bi70]
MSPIMTNFARNRYLLVLNILAVFLCFNTIYLAIQAGSFEYEATGNIVGQLEVGVSGSQNLKWMMLSDMFGFYLFSIPSALYLWFALREHQPYLLSLSTIAGILFGIVGAIGAAILSVAWPILTVLHASATDPASGVIFQEIFRVLTMVVQDGMWGRLEFFLSGIWYLGLAIVIWRHKKLFAVVLMINSVCALVSSFGKIFDMGELAGLALTGVTYATPVFYIWLGIIAWCGPRASINTYSKSFGEGRSS